MGSSCDHCRQENLWVLFDRQLTLGFGQAAAFAMSQEGVTAFFEGQVVKLVWGLAVHRSRSVDHSSQGPTPQQVFWVGRCLSCLTSVSWVKGEGPHPLFCGCPHEELLQQTSPHRS